MTVHARRLARQCRERLAAQEAVPVAKQPEQRHAAAEASWGNTTDARRPATGGATI
ncbi:hypothetical protein [Actinophytocola sp.]|uniref:hypothetical protein n=1 Tax=Actinophytocola sp. TaxID=1872138 RepID=UPI003D6C4E8E